MVISLGQKLSDSSAAPVAACAAMVWLSICLRRSAFPLPRFHLDCPAARSCLARAALLFIICRTWCCERSCQHLFFGA